MAGTLIISACATTRVYSETELSEVARTCGVAEDSVIQEPDHPRFLFLYANGPTPAQIDCVRRWSRQRHMSLATIQAIESTEELNATQN
jgi:hypothetical protein